MTEVNNTSFNSTKESKSNTKINAQDDIKINSQDDDITINSEDNASEGNTHTTSIAAQSSASVDQSSLKRLISDPPLYKTRRSNQIRRTNEDSLTLSSPHMLLASANDDSCPSYNEAMAGPFRQEFQEAIRKEYNSLFAHQVFSSPCQCPPGIKPLRTKLVLRIKETPDADGKMIFKARLCGKGFSQQYGVDYEDTFAPVAGHTALRLLITICASLNYEIDTVDVITAFLHAPLKEQIYIEIPDGYPDSKVLQNSNMVIQLKKSLYGLKQAPKDWNMEIEKFFIQLGFKPTIMDPCLYVGTFQTCVCYLLLYVDDIFLGAPNRQTIGALKQIINYRFKIKDGGPLSSYLNIKFERNRDTWTFAMHQSTKIIKLVSDAEKSGFILPWVSTPMDTQMPLSTSSTSSLEHSLPYKQYVGRLLYIALTTRPDISTAVSNVGRFAHNPDQNHWLAVLRIIGYLKGTSDLVLVLGGKHLYPHLTSYSDSDWAGDKDQRKSRSGYALYLNDSLISWSSKMQSTIAKSTMEAEYYALTVAVEEVQWARNLLKEIGYPQKENTTVRGDNQACLQALTNNKLIPGLKHIELRHHWLRQKMYSGDTAISLEYIRSEDNTADIFTKALEKSKFLLHRKSLGLVPKEMFVKGSVGMNNSIKS